MSAGGDILMYLLGRLPYALPLFVVAVAGLWLTVRRLSAFPATFLLAFPAFLALGVYSVALAAVLAVVDFGAARDPRTGDIVAWWNIGGYAALLLALVLMIAAAFMDRKRD